MLPAGEAQKARSATSSGTELTDVAKRIFFLMQHSCMRLIVPTGDRGIVLVDDPRLPWKQGNKTIDIVDKMPVIELIRKGLISRLSENGENNKIGWREMFKGHEDQIPEGAQVFCVTQ